MDSTSKQARHLAANHSIEELMVLREIELLQNIQKAHPTWHPEWRKASERLAPLFAAMAARSKVAA